MVIFKMLFISNKLIVNEVGMLQLGIISYSVQSYGNGMILRLLSRGPIRPTFTQFRERSWIVSSKRISEIVPSSSDIIDSSGVPAAGARTMVVVLLFCNLVKNSTA